MPFRLQTTVRREGWYYLAIAAIVVGGAVFNGVNLLLILGGMLLGPVLFNWRAVKTNLLGLRLDRQLPQRLSAGDRLAVSLTLTNTRPRLGCWGVRVEEQVRRETTNGRNGRQPTPIALDVAFSYVPAGQSSKETYLGRLAQRGRYRFGPAKISTRFPFGLFSRTIDAGTSDSLVVLPRLGRLTEHWAARRLDAFAGADRRRRRAGAEGDFYGVREWRSGDGRRLIHWRGSARLGKLLVRQFERPRSRDAALVLDLWRPDAPDDIHRDSLELAVSFAATVLADLCRKGGSRVSLAVCDPEPECLGGPASAAVLQGMLERLATVEAQPRDALPSLLAHALPKIPAGAEIVLVSTRPVDPADAGRFDALGHDPLLRERLRHIRCIDASSEALSEFFEAE